MRDEALFAASVRRELVHKRSVSEVFLTHFVQSSSRRFVARAQWPRWHVFYGSPDDSPDSALMAETLRQAVIFLCHLCGVPLAHKLLMPHMRISVAAATLDPMVPAQVAVELNVKDMKLSAGRLSALTVSARFAIDGAVIGEGAASARIVNAATYQRLRGAVPAAPEEYGGDLLDCVDVGHATQRNVMLGQSQRPFAWPLRVDPTHPIFFDHPLDHVPGMLLVEAARQAVRASCSRPDADFALFKAEFTKLIEFSYPVDVVVTKAGSNNSAGVLKVRMLHNGETLMSLQAWVKDPR
ncbi:ScbA/BarX family gamma-butyrolactone biosynthesis protein [Arthrobacter sp. NA-172]|uniref:ScbA/BarX family gamma-butyrolactone biosynthesis protein n=1 Tax=Arthrobacter sp. NA-172 TaxID=3367524 RepID=UPI003754558B